MVVACSRVTALEVDRGGGFQKYLGGSVGLVCDGSHVGGVRERK